MKTGKLKKHIQKEFRSLRENQVRNFLLYGAVSTFTIAEMFSISHKEVLRILENM